jgi:tachylectin
MADVSHEGGLRMAGALYWYQHRGTGYEKGDWAYDGVARQVGTNLIASPGIPLDWGSYDYLFPAEDGVIYGVDKHGCLYWHQHLARSEGVELARSWAKSETGAHRVHVGAGLNVNWNIYLPAAHGSSSIQPHLFAADQGAIYGVDASGCLQWYQHRGRGDGTDDWADGSGKPIGTQLMRLNEGINGGPASIGCNDWSYKLMFAADDGVIYGAQGPDLTVNGRMYWYRHLGRGNGNDSFAQPLDNVHSVHVGSAWNYDQVSAADDDAIYGVNTKTDAPGSLFWYRHLGRSDGRTEWSDNGMGRRVDKNLCDPSGASIDWTKFRQVFAVEDRVIYAVK